MNPGPPSDPEPRTASVHGGRFFYTDVGQGPAVVAVHGMPGSARDFRHLGAGLEPRCRFVRLNLPGFGGTPAELAATTVDARADFVVAALEALELRDAVLIGHSMGGPVALAAASRAPGRVRALGLLASVGLTPHRLLRRAAGRTWMGRAVDVPVAGPVLRRVAQRAFRASGFPASTSPEEVAQTLRVLGVFSFEPVHRAVAELRLPTLVAFAEDDPFIEPEIARALAAAVPAGPRLSWPIGGHNIQKSHAAELANALAGM
ncbi:MAG: alpha/beta fold hydrolase [Deltaproteobacteria bacterium]|nr:alpha/beta fold hydrolase [Deltaproteobacteria bacterium]